MRQIEHIGCARKVYARRHGDGKRSRRLLCLKLLREPVEADCVAFLAGGARSDYPDNIDARASDAESEDELEGSTNILVDHQAEKDEPVGQELEEDGRLVSQWTPVRHSNNMIFDIVDATGTEGISTKVRARSL